MPWSAPQTTTLAAPEPDPRRMRWFKHMADLRRDENVARYLDACGRDELLAYGFLMKLFEVLTERLQPEHDAIAVSYPLRTWQQLLGCHANRVRKLLGICEVAGVVVVRFSEGLCEVRCNKLLDFRDEYSRKVRSVSGQCRTDQSKEKSRERAEGEGMQGEGECETFRGPPPVTEAQRGSANGKEGGRQPPGLSNADVLRKYHFLRRAGCDIDSITSQLLEHGVTANRIRSILEANPS